MPYLRNLLIRSQGLHQLLVCSLLSLLVLSLHAQTAIYAPRFADGWSMSVAGGGTHPLVYSFTQQLLRPTASLSLHKQLTPSLGMELEAAYNWGDQADERTYYNRSQLLALGSLNLSRWWGGYRGRPRRLEFVLKGGAGWGHTYDPYSTQADYIVAKAGAEINLFLSRSRAWSLGLRPSVCYNLRSSKAFEHLIIEHSQADLQCALALTYHFPNSRGGHHLAAVLPVIVQPVEREPVTEVIEDLQLATAQMRKDINVKEELIVKQKQRIAELEQKMATDSLKRAAVRNRPKATPSQSSPTKSKVKPPSIRRLLLEERIAFSANSVVIAATEFAALDRLAAVLQKNPQAYIVIQGCTSPEGSKDINARVSQSRADAVRNLLIAQYGIRRERIRTMTGGTSKHRIAICTIFREEAAK